MKRRILSVLTALALCLSLLPTTALAASTRTVNTASELRSAVRNAGSGDVIKLGADINFSLGDWETVTGVYRNRSVATTVSETWILERLIFSWEVYSRGTTSATIHIPDDPDGIMYRPNVPDTRSRNLDAICGVLIENKNLTIDLNNHTLSGTGGASGAGNLYSVLFVTGNSQVTIQGNGRVESNSGSAVAAYGGGAKVTINGGNFKGATAAVSSLYEAEIVISGGTFEGPNWTERTVSELFSVKYTKDGVPGPEGAGGEKFTRWRIHYTITGIRTYPVYGGTLYSEMNGKFIISGNPTVRAPTGGTLGPV